MILAAASGLGGYVLSLTFDVVELQEVVFGLGWVIS
jgi:hypothetical protein